MGDWIAHQIAHRFIRGVGVGFVAAIVIAGLTGFFGVPKGAAMGYSFYTGLLFGLTSLITPLSQKAAASAPNNNQNKSSQPSK